MVYIFSAGYVVRSLKLRCDECTSFMAASSQPHTRDDATLLSVKDRGGLFTPQPVATQICLGAEKIIRQCISLNGLTQNICQEVVAKTFLYVYLSNIHQQFSCHSHSNALIKSIAARYTKIRIHHETTKSAANKENLRSKLNRLVVFSHV